MGKANKKKNQSSISVGTDQEESAQPLYWEYLMDFVGKITNSLLNNTAMVKQLTATYQDVISSNPQIGMLLKGFALSLEDIGKATGEVMKRHVIFDANGIQIGNKTGLVDGMTDDAIEFLAITNEYNSLLDRLNALSSNGYLNIFMKLKAYDVDKVASFTNNQPGVENGK